MITGVAVGDYKVWDPGYSIVNPEIGKAFWPSIVGAPESEI